MDEIDDTDAAGKELATLDGLAWAAWAWVGSALIAGGGSGLYLCLRGGSGSLAPSGHPDLALGLIVLVLTALLAVLGAMLAMALQVYAAPRMLRLKALRKQQETAAVVDEGW